MNNGINPHQGAAAAAVLHAPQDPGSPPRQATQPAAEPPAAPRKQTAQQIRSALRERVAARTGRNDIELQPSANLALPVAQAPAQHAAQPDAHAAPETLLQLPNPVLTAIASRQDAIADVEALRLAAIECRQFSLSAIVSATVEDPADLGLIVSRYPNLETISLVGDGFSDASLQQLRQCTALQRIEVLQTAAERMPTLAATTHLPKAGALDADLVNLADSLPAEREAEHARLMNCLRGLFPVVPGERPVEIVAEPLPVVQARRQLML